MGITALVRFAYVMALRRAATGWRLEMVLFGGVLLAVALMASGVVFSDLLSNAALRHALRQAPAEQANFWVRSYSSQEEAVTAAEQRAVYQSKLDFVEQRLAQPFQGYLKDRSRVMDTATFFYQGHAQLELDNDVRPRGSITYVSGLFPERARLVRGEWPAGPGPQGLPSGAPLDVAVDSLGAELLQLDVGGVMEVVPAASFTGPPPMRVRIAGVFERTNPGDEFWYGMDGEFSLKNDRWTIIPLFTTEEALLGRVLDVYPGLYTDTTWYFYLDRDGLRSGDVDAVQQAVADAERDVRTGLGNSSAFIRLDNVLSSFDEQLLLARVPLFLVIFLVTGILVYYLALVAGLIVRSRSSEIAMLKSRGATTPQIGLLGLGEGLLLAAPAVVIGPLLAVGVVRILGDIFFSLGGADELSGVPVSLSTGAFYLGLAGGALAVAVFTIATLLAARHGIVEARQSGARPPTTSVLHRYYLDLLLLALIGLLWWQIQSRGAFLVQTVGSRELEIDYSLLFGPVLGLLAAGLVVMRVFPLFALLLSRLAGPFAPSWLVHGLRHVARDPMAPAVLVVLLMSATALGVIGSAFSSTLERSQRERALYAAGADLRVQHSGVTGPAGLASTAAGLPGVAMAADVFRTNGHLTTTGFSTSGALLAVEADRFADVVWFRDDFGRGRPVSGLLEDLTPDPGQQISEDGIVLPDDAMGLALWARPGSVGNGVNLWARFRDSAGQYFDSWVGGLGFQDWTRLNARIEPAVASRGGFGAERQAQPISRPLTLMSLQVTSRFGADETGSLFLGRLDALTPRGDVQLADFRTADGWGVIEDYARPGLHALETSLSATGGQFPSSTRFSWATGGVGIRGFGPGQADAPLPALVSPSFLDIADAQVGDLVTVGMSTYSLRLEVKDVVDYFPTLDPAEEPFAVVDLAGFQRAANRHSPARVAGPNELWLSLDGPGFDYDGLAAVMDGAGARVRETHDAAALIAGRVDQPLVSAGWGALLVLLFLAVALASASGVMLFSYLDSRDRQTEFALLRTLGSSGGQLRGVVWFNLFLIVVCGVGLGTWVGRLIGTGLLPLMEVAEEGARVTPSMVFTLDWGALAVTYLVLAGVTAVTVVWLAWLSSKIQLQQVLRMGDAG